MSIGYVPESGAVVVKEEDVTVQDLSATLGQQRLWFLQKLAPASWAHNSVARLEIVGELDALALESALRHIIKRHEAFRAVFYLNPAGELRQRILPNIPFNLEIEDAPGNAEQRLIDAACMPFNPAQAPLFRFKLYRVTPERHFLLIATSQMIADDQSLRVIFDELTALYRTFALGQAPALPPVFSYSDYLRHERSNVDLGKLQAFWQTELAGLPPQLDLPTDHPYPLEQSFAGDFVSVRLSPETQQQLQTFADLQNVSRQVVLLAAFNMLLNRYTNQSDLPVGVSVPNRRSDANLVAPIAETLVLRTELARPPTFRELVQQVDAKNRTAVEHGNFPFQKLVEILQPPRDQRRNPIIQTSFVYHDLNTAASALPESNVSFVLTVRNYRTSRYDLTLNVFETAGELALEIEYNSDVFESGTIELMAQHFVNLLEGALANPDLPIARLFMLTDAEKYRQLIEWNRNVLPVPQVATLRELIEEQAQRQPNAIALADRNGMLTYAQLNERANRLAHYLRNKGIGPDKGVAVCLPRTNGVIVTLLAVLKAGGFYLPLDPNYPVDRLAYILEDAGVNLLLADSAVLPSELAQRVPPNLEIIESRDLFAGPAPANFPTTNPPALPGMSANNLLYVLYTSGSTGKPKGVAIENRSVLALTAWVSRLYAPPELDGVLFSTSLCFDISVFEVWSTLALGGKVIVAENALDLLAAHPRTTELRLINTVPSAIAELLRLDAVPPSVSVINLAGEPLSNKLVQQLYRRYPTVQKIYNLYGPTEDTVYSTWYRVEKGVTGAMKIGKPLNNTQAYVLDEEKQPVPVGVAGELYLGGAGLARGYYGREDLTAARFVPNPYAADFGSERLYRTGDLVRWDKSGELEYLGRLDQQVKLRGFRIELDEIGRVLEKQSGVVESAIVVREDTPGDKRIVAYLALAQEAENTLNEIKGGLGRELPAYMLPSAYVVLPQLPRLPNGKLNRHVLPLPAPDFAFAPEAAQFVPPATPVQETLSKIFAEVLSLETVSATADFFDLGGHSLKATQIIVRIREAFSLDLPLKVIFDAPTVVLLEAEIAKRSTNDANAYRVITPLAKSANGEIEMYPLSSAQKRLWFIYELNPQSPVYNVVRGLRLSGQLDRDALERSLTAIAERHEVLRTTFRLVNDEPQQVISPRGKIPLKFTDLSELPAAQLEKAVAAQIDAEANAPFRLETGPLARAVLLKLQPDEHLLILNIHHIVFDGWSFSVLFRELSTLYNAFKSGEPSPLAPPTLQYTDYAEWQREWLQSDARQRQLDFWKKYLDGAPTLLELPTDRPRPAVTSFNGGICEFNISAELSRKLVAVGKERGATLHMLLIAAFDVLLYRYTGQADLLVGTPFANRERVEIEDMPGFFVNSLIVRTRLAPADTFGQVLDKVRDSLLQIHDYQSLPFENLVEALQPQRSLGYNPLFQVLLVLQNTPTFKAKLDGLTAEVREIENDCAKFDLLIQVVEKTYGLDGHLRYNADIFDRASAERLTACWLTLLESLVAAPDSPLDQLEILPAVERHKLLHEWSGTSAAYPHEKSVATLFEEQVAANPSATALVMGDRSLTYVELNERANAVAAYLTGRGVVGGTPVGFCLERSFEMLAVILGILKAGGVYVPFDANYPQERLAFMVADTATPLILTERQFMAKLPPSSTSTALICLEDIAADLSRTGIPNPPPVAQGENTAYIMYTSGSTGTPKGTLVPHRAITRLVRNTTYADFGADNIFLQFAPVSFDAATLEIWGSLLNGAQLVICPPHQLSLDELGGLIERHKVNFLWLTSGLFSQMVQEQGARLATVRQVLAGGDVLQPEYVRQLLTLMDGRGKLINGYGPTENTTFTTCYPLTSALSGANVKTNIPIGRPITNTRVYVLDKNRRLVPTGVPGELYVGGDGLAQGYLNRPELTAEKFVPDPFVPGEKLYKTGDLVRWLPDGNLEFLGRLDFQVKIRGYRVELGEIETALVKHPAVEDCVVVVREATPGTKQLVAYLTLAANENATAPSGSQLREFVRARLPEPMTPAAFVVLPEFPLDPNGKVARRALPPPDKANSLALADTNEQADLPQTELERQLAAIWADVLQLELADLRLGTNFFDVGGHSLLATRLVARVRQTLEADVSIRDLFGAPVLGDFAARVQSSPKLAATSANPIKRIVRQPRG
jgi:amino acid adenylation domain-containing protein